MKINTDPMNMDALDFDGDYVGSGILQVCRNSEQYKPVVNHRGMNFVHASRHN